MLAKVVINEQHKLLPDQERALKEAGFKEIKFLKIPKDGLTKEEQLELAEDLEKDGGCIVFASPVPVLMAKVAFWTGYGAASDNVPLKGCFLKVFVLHNDRRDKKELPNGNIVSVVAKEGWEVVPIRN